MADVFKWLHIRQGILGGILNVVKFFYRADAAISELSSFTGLDYAHLGVPFCEGLVSTSADESTMDFAYLGQPFVRVKR